MLKKNGIRLTILLIIFFTFNNIIAAQLISKDKINIGENVTITLDFGTYVAAYDSLEVSYNNKVLEFISGDSLKDGVWFDNTQESNGIRRKTYTFKGTRNGICTVRVKVKGAVSANKNMDELGDIEIYKTITVGTGYLQGDYNSDGKVNAIDASYVIDLYTNSQVTEDDIKVCDMNGDGKLNAIDASIILDEYNE